jgi:hypothetical protein
MRFSVAVLLCLLALPANSEPMDFSIYKLTTDGRALIGQGKLDYSMEDIDVVEWPSKDGHQAFRKSLSLGMGFRIGTLVVRGSEITGFGLWIRNDHHPDGFSWEWFFQESGYTFKKLQGEGRVRISQAPCPEGTELRSVVFLDDITLRFKEDLTPEPGNETHEVVVSRGSVLRVGGP